MPNDRTPLLPATQPVQELPPPLRYLVRDHPIFLRACHSPWTFIPQTTLIWARGIIVVYLTLLAPVLFNLATNRDPASSNWSIAFDFSIISFTLLWLYHAIVFTWANTHCRWAEIDEYDDSWRARLLRAMSPPVQRPGDRKRFWFSLFYTTTQVFALVNALPMFREVRVVDPAGLLTFWTVNIWGVTVLVVLGEVMFLNNVKRQVPITGHVLGLAALPAAYVNWTAVGKVMTGRSPYWFLDPDVVDGLSWMVLYAAGFVALGPLGFALLYGLIGVREKATRRGGGGT
ncbi:hypothetical protein GE09DRAFT_1224810 [Coniochaeta sp. 2T2.1]|nr:hypothetical protein GE09DRAFT_1224810 [Coniochaeta sp. 2T2.1]